MQFTPVKIENKLNKQQKGKSTRQTQRGSEFCNSCSKPTEVW